MKAIALFILMSFVFCSSSAYADGIDQLMERYSSASLSLSPETTPQELHCKIVKKLDELEIFTKRGRGENNMVLVPYYRFSETFWEEFKKILVARSELRMYYFRYIDGERKGINDAFAFWRR